MFFALFMAIITGQRFVELWIARKNENWIKAQGGIEVGQRHYKCMVLIHICFFVSLIVEVIELKKSIITNWWIPLIFFVITQIGRIWVIKSLGRYWNTKILYIPNAQVVTEGPYKFLKHPNYLIVTMELVIIPLIFQAYYTLMVFFILNQIILAIRIRMEERILGTYTNYLEVLKGMHRFLPIINKGNIK